MSAVVYIRYALVFLAVAFGVGALVAFFNTNMNSTLGSSAQLMVPAMIASVIEGSQFAKGAHRKPNTREAWGFAWIAAAIASGLNVVLAFLPNGLLPEFAKLAVAAPNAKQFLILLGLYAGGYLIFNRLFVSIGAGNQLSLLRSRGEIE